MHVVVQDARSQAVHVQLGVERVTERDVHVLLQGASVEGVEQGDGGDRDVEIDVDLLDDVVVARPHARQPDAQREARSRGFVEGVRWHGGDARDERRIPRSEEVVEDVGRRDEVVLAGRDRELPLDAEPIIVGAAREPKVGLGLHLGKLDAQRVLGRWSRVGVVGREPLEAFFRGALALPRTLEFLAGAATFVGVDVDLHRAEVAHHKAGRVVHAHVDRDERVARWLGRVLVEHKHVPELDAKAARAAEDHRLREGDVGDAEGALGLARLHVGAADPVVRAAQLHGEDRVQLDVQLVLRHDGSRNLAEDGKIIHDEGARDLGLDFPSAAERAGERVQGAKALAAKGEVELG
mmetsp:Transcript_3344/g.9807  ORF Transcript_3344/g.9807 Transcript_3344/m.9807 type:complete len:351 (-) Transcript_3344:322-1374(-)